MKLCGSRGFAGPTACVLERGHSGSHEYGDFAQALADEQRKDAERYRWIRDNPTWIGYDADYRPEEVDAVIDAAMNGSR